MTEKTPPSSAPPSTPQEKTWSVRIIDLSIEGNDNVVEEVKIFHDLSHANAFARAYVRDSIERCRNRGTSTHDILTTWRNFGEDAVVVGADENAWQSAHEIEHFAADPATPMERDWRALDPRRLIEDEEHEISRYL